MIDVNNSRGRDTVITTLTYSDRTESSFYDQGDGIEILSTTTLYDNGTVKTFEKKMLNNDTVFDWSRHEKNRFGQVMKSFVITKNKLKRSIIWIEETNTP